MFKNEPATDKAEVTRERIFRSALDLFRENGFDAATMQQIADRAEVAKSAAYYYFSGKEAIVHAYQESLLAEQERICAEAFASSKDLKTRLAFAMNGKFDLVQNFSSLLAIAFRHAGEPKHSLSCLGAGTAEARLRTMRIFAEAIAKEDLPKDLRELLPTALWALEMGLLLMFLHDDSPNHQRTRRLSDGALELTLKLAGLARSPILKPIRKRILSLLREAELIPAL